MKPRPRKSPHTSRTPRPDRPRRPAEAATKAASKAPTAATPAPIVPPRAAPPARRPDDFSVTSCDCDVCKAACLNAPGWFMPDQIPRLARHLGLSVEETFRKYLAIGVTHLADGTLHPGVMPHKLRDGKKPGSRWSLAEIARPGRCVFYDRGRCSIHAVRPFECARMMHDRGEQAVRLRKRIVPKWTEAAIAPFLALTRSAAGAGSRARK